MFGEDRSFEKDLRLIETRKDLRKKLSENLSLDIRGGRER